LKHARNDLSKSSSSRMATTNPVRGRQWLPLAKRSLYAVPPQGAAAILGIAAGAMPIFDWKEMVV
jgi:hypothetical protein